MKTNDKLATVRELMLEFAAITGLFPAASSPKRYLWTDAFGVYNFLELYRQTGADRYTWTWRWCWLGRYMQLL